jgi:putative glutamine amidotransferase
VRPRIAITSWKRHLPTFLGERTDLYTLGVEYVECVARPGALPLLLPHLAPDDADAALGGVDALVVAGGGDVDPASYGADNTGSYDHDAAADASELALLRAARNRGMPTLAICRGMQLVNVAFGGTLHQDIGVPGGVHEPISHIPQEVLDATHPIEVVASSRLAAVVGAGERVVNTIHHQAIDRLADGFQVTATAPDGVIEAIEPDDDAWPVLAVQWHPEKADGQDEPLFAWLADAARTHAARTSPSGTAPAGRR